MTAEQMMKKKVWAVVGATANTEKYGYKIYKELKDAGYTVYPVSPNVEEIDGDKVYKSLADLPSTPEVVDFVVNPKIGIGIVEECAALGIQNIWLQPGTVSEDLLALAEEKKINAVQACVLVALRTMM